MSLWYVNIPAVFVLSALFAGFIIPRILLIAFRKRLFDIPNERKVHRQVVPRLGGIAFNPIVFLSFILLAGINLSIGNHELHSAVGHEAQALTYAACAMLFLYLVGTADDLIGVRYRMKFLVQLACGVMLIAGGYVLTHLCGMFTLGQLSPWISYPLTIFSVIFILNAINLIDGLDGLASGLCILALLVYGISFIYYGVYLYAMLAFASLGVLVPFYYYNVFGNANRGRKIFMGDTGSLTIGMMICLLSLKLLSVASAVADPTLPNPFVLAFAPLLIPCMDVVRVYFHRVRNGHSPFLPDKNHIHHKLIDCGLSARQAMLVIVSASLVLTLLNILVSGVLDVTLLLLLDAALYTVINIQLTRQIKARAKKRAERNYILLDNEQLQHEIA
jgi:UDP-N-acetylmuramyl pentapeptide phosphotransferase/UDP-N-acetylglucosamine-1-phosphate transferase